MAGDSVKRIWRAEQSGLPNIGGKAVSGGGLFCFPQSVSADKGIEQAGDGVVLMERAHAVSRKQGKKRKFSFKRSWPIYALALPGFVYMICNNYIPMFGIVIAFKKLNFAKGILGSPWNGFNNFRFLFASDTAFAIIRNTVCYNMVFILLGNAMAVGLAILLNEVKNKMLFRFYQSVILLPFLISWVIVSCLAYAILSVDTGLINQSILKPLGFSAVNFYSAPKYWPFIIVIANSWKTLGYSMVIYLSSIVGMNPEYYEAAQIDGATKWQRIRHITLPLLTPTMIVIFILSIGKIMNSDFGLFYQIPRNSGLLYKVTQTIDVYVFNALLNNSDYGMSSAASVLQSLLGFLLVLATNYAIRKKSPENAIF